MSRHGNAKVSLNTGLVASLFHKRMVLFNKKHVTASASAFLQRHVGCVH